MAWLRRALGMAAKVEPGAKLITPAKLYIGPPATMSLDDAATRAKRLREVIPQYEEKIARARRKLGRGAAKLLVEKRAELQHQLMIYEARLKAAAEGR